MGSDRRAVRCIAVLGNLLMILQGLLKLNNVSVALTGLLQYDCRIYGEPVPCGFQIFDCACDLTFALTLAVTTLWVTRRLWSRTAPLLRALWTVLGCFWFFNVAFGWVPLLAGQV